MKLLRPFLPFSLSDSHFNFFKNLLERDRDEDIIGGIELYLHSSIPGSHFCLPWLMVWVFPMAGMLPGVESARRRRFHQSGGWPDLPSMSGTRRSSFCLYASNHESHLSSSSFQQRITINQANQDEKLGGAAREAKDRLDKRLRAAQLKPENKREISQESLMGGMDDGRMVVGDLQKEVFGLKKKKSSRSKRFSWAKLGRKGCDQDECVVCLEQFRAGETLLHLPCAHRFHSQCLVPWLQNNAHCPCCRMGIFI
ncbi:probable E3 ubiquitin-protein ligase RHY1A isoform X2 [Cornus florida]|uniref:probable E3 ubiquitin-protein ligase RHY1A isoform X2 n=1 Tax=Cornus florida TaxID=4283 RepID=UPI002896C9AA|nr:probable E3 ubiquitin-protein ligase RHY1A isoform X2 [Cornus florida]